MLNAVELKNVTKKFGDNTVLDELDLDVRDGEKVSIIGPSGSGKTTILRAIMTLEPIDSGEITIYGASLHAQAGKLSASQKSDQKSVRSQIGMVFQNFNLFPNMSVERNIMLPQVLRGLSNEKARLKAHELLEIVGLQEKLTEWPSNLSGGQKQRVAIARALALDPKVMLFDEVTSALDPEVKQDVMNVLFDISDRIKMTMILVTHEMSFAHRFSDRIIMFDKGKIVESGHPDSIFQTPEQERTKTFLQQVSEAGYAL